MQILREKLRKREFTKIELKKLQIGISNAEFHYLGSGKVMAGIGIGFANAILKLQR